MPISQTSTDWRKTAFQLAGQLIAFAEEDLTEDPEHCKELIEEAVFQLERVSDSLE